MADMTDDWMNPQTSYFVPTKEPKNATVYRILRQKRVICFGNPGSIVEWRVYETFDTAGKRDAQLAKLRKEHPMWRLEATEGNPYFERLGTYSAGSL